MNHYNPQMLKDVVAGFVRFVDRRHRNNEIYDAAILPFPKQTILDCCLHRLSLEKNPLIRKTISDGLLCAAFFQDGIGLEPMQNCRLDLFTMDLSSLDEQQLNRVKQTVAEHLSHLDSDKFIATLRLVQAEFKRLNDACEAIERQHETTSVVSG